MLIKDIPYPKVREAAEQYFLKHSDYLNNGPSVMDFSWGKTPEGYEFWLAVYTKNWDHAKELYPHLFEADPITAKYDLSSVPTDELEEWLNAANEEMEKRNKPKMFKVGFKTDFGIEGYYYTTDFNLAEYPTPNDMIGEQFTMDGKLTWTSFEEVEQ